MIKQDFPKSLANKEFQPLSTTAPLEGFAVSIVKMSVEE